MKQRVFLSLDRSLLASDNQTERIKRTIASVISVASLGSIFASQSSNSRGRSLQNSEKLLTTRGEKLGYTWFSFINKPGTTCSEDLL
jgi:hypothetical protein